MKDWLWHGWNWWCDLGDRFSDWLPGQEPEDVRIVLGTCQRCRVRPLLRTDGLHEHPPMYCTLCWREMLAWLAAESNSLRPRDHGAYLVGKVMEALDTYMQGNRWQSWANNPDGEKAWCELVERYRAWADWRAGKGASNDRG